MSDNRLIGQDCGWLPSVRRGFFKQAIVVRRDDFSGREGCEEAMGKRVVTSRQELAYCPTKSNSVLL